MSGVVRIGLDREIHVSVLQDQLAAVAGRPLGCITVRAGIHPYVEEQR